MKAPPTNHVWFSFKEMPEMDLVSEPSIGDHRISSGPLAAFVVQQLKVWIYSLNRRRYCAVTADK